MGSGRGLNLGFGLEWGREKSGGGTERTVSGSRDRVVTSGRHRTRTEGEGNKREDNEKYGRRGLVGEWEETFV